MRLRRTGLAAVLLGLLFSAAPAGSAFGDDPTTALPGAPLAVHVGQRGQLQAFRSRQRQRHLLRASELAGDAGFFLAFPGGFPGSPARSLRLRPGRAGPDGLTEYVLGSPVAPRPAAGITG